VSVQNVFLFNYYFLFEKFLWFQYDQLKRGSFKRAIGGKKTFIEFEVGTDNWP